jgi:hypothetical protein
MLNDAYKPHNIKFEFTDHEKTVKPKWSGNCNELEMKMSLRKGTYADLNVYFLSSINCLGGVEFGSGVLGYAEWPADDISGTQQEIMDSVLVRADTVPGGRAPFDEGKTLVHEVGHWLGRSQRWSARSANNLLTS